jgi:hypothetical protein
VLTLTVNSSKVPTVKKDAAGYKKVSTELVISANLSKLLKSLVEIYGHFG